MNLLENYWMKCNFEFCKSHKKEKDSEYTKIKIILNF